MKKKMETKTQKFHVVTWPDNLNGNVRGWANWDGPFVTKQDADDCLAAKFAFQPCNGVVLCDDQVADWLDAN